MMLKLTAKGKELLDKLDGLTSYELGVLIMAKPEIYKTKAFNKFAVKSLKEKGLIGGG
jgi:hypothetical protein